MKRYCNARTRPGAKWPRCRHAPMKNGRCRMHGGKLKGGSLPGHDTRKSFMAWRRWLDLLHTMGLKHPGGRPRKLKTVLTMTEQAKAVLVVAAKDLTEALPSDVLQRPIEELSPAQALGRAALSGSHQLIRIIEQPLDMNDLKQQRLIGDMAGTALRLFVRAAEGEFQARRDDVLGQLLAAIKAEKEDHA